MIDRHHRRSVRLHDYDYTQAGAYFVTMCAHERRCLFGEIIDATMTVNLWGKIVQDEWDQTAVLRSNVELDAFVIMPNHIHGIVVITDIPMNGRNALRPYDASTPKRGVTANNVAANSLGSIVRTFKASVTRRLNRLPTPPDHPLWQRSYHEHIIRNEDSLNHIRTYIALNAAKWADDSL